MRIGRIARSDALYDASIPAQIPVEIEQVIINPIDFDEIVEADITKATEIIKFALIEGYG